MKPLLRIALLLFVLFTTSFLVADRLGWLDSEEIWARLEAVAAHPHAAWIGAGLVVGLLVADLLLPIPSSIVMTFSGGLLGFGLGAAAAFAGSMAAALTGFYACRWGGRRAFRRLAGERDAAHVEDWFRRRGVLAIIVSRPVPMLTEILSCLAGLSGLRPRTFVAANVLGHLPVSLLYAYAGSRGARGEYGLLIFALLLLPAAGWWFTRRIRGMSSVSSTNPAPG